MLHEIQKGLINFPGKNKYYHNIKYVGYVYGIGIDAADVSAVFHSITASGG